MPKKQPKNAYFFYMLHFKEKEAQRGRHYPGGLPEISTVASDSWRNMNAQQRGPFEKQAKEHKQGSQKEVEKYTSQGIPLSQIKREEQAACVAQRSMKMTIKEIVQNAYTNNTLAAQEFFFVSGNYFIKTTDETYFPAEFAIVKFTFEDGIVSKYHTTINPEKLPLGFQYDAKSWSEESHRLPIPPNAKGERNYATILQQINNFIGKSRPPMFTQRADIPIIESFMKEFCALGDDDPSSYRIYPLHQLFYDLKEEAVKNSIDGVPFHSIHIAEAHLNRDQYVYLKDTACTYHEEIDCSKFCALSIVQRWAYIFADHICVDLNVQVIAGQHFPPEVDVSHVNSTAFSESKLNDTTTTNGGDDTESQISSSAAATSHMTPQWVRRPASPDRRVSSSNEDDFPTLGSHSRKAGASKRREETHRDYNNPWNTSTSSSDSNPWTGRRETQHPSDSRARGRGNDTYSSLDSSTSTTRGMGRGSELFRNNESQRGRGRLHNDDDDRPSKRDHRKHDRKDRYHPWRSEKKDHRDAKRKH